MKTMEDAFRFMMRGKYLDAEAVYRKIIGESPENIVAFCELSWIYLLQHKYGEAEAALRHVVRLAPDNIPARYDLARVCLLQRKYEDAQEALEQCTSISGSVAAQYQLGRIYRLQGRQAQAAAIFDSLRQSAPYLSTEEEEGFFDSLIRLDPVGLTDSSSSVEDLTMEDPKIGSSPGRLPEVGATLMDLAGDIRGPLATEATNPAQKSPTSAHGVFHSETERPKDLAGAIFDDVLFKERLLGQGGMGEVYLVRHREWDQKLAAKRCLQTDNKLLLERFRQECLAWLSLEKHPNVVSAVHFTNWEGKPSLLIEYIEGSTLKDFLHNMRIASMADRILGKLGKRPPLSNTMSLLTYMGIAEERKEIAEAWLTIVKEHSRLTVEEVKNILREARAFPEHDIEFLQNRWFQLKNVQDLMRPTLEHLLDYSLQICWGMAHAHRHGMIHRDLKPANILIEEEVGGAGRLKVTDFGLAKMKSSRHREEADHEAGQDESGAAGTPRYMAPEQWDNVASEKSDIYSFGIIAYEIFSRGRSPFSSHIEEQSKTSCWWAQIPQQNEFYYWSVRHSSEQPIPLSSLVKDVPEKLEKLILACLAKDQAERPKDFGEVAARLLSIYREMSGTEYPREQSIAPDLMAMELNNRALSMLEMGFAQEGQRLFEKAREMSPNLIEVQLNQALFDLSAQNLSLAEFINKTLNCFGLGDKDIMVLSALLGVYFQFGSHSHIMRKQVEIVENKFGRDFKFKRLQGKFRYLLGEFAASAEIFEELSSLENSRIEDWYHLVGALYHGHRLELLQEKLDQAPEHIRYHPGFREIKRLVQRPGTKPASAGDWFEVAALENDYRANLPITFLKNIPGQDYFLLYHSNCGQNVCESFHIPSWERKIWMLPTPNAITACQVELLSDNTMAVLSTAGEICLFNFSTRESQRLPCVTPVPGYHCRDGFLAQGQGCLLAVFHLQNEAEQVLSQAVVWRQKDFVAQWQTAGEVRHAAVYDEKLCWLSDGRNLYTWNLPGKMPLAQAYGRKKQTRQGCEESEIAAVYALPQKKLLVLLQKAVTGEDGGGHGTLSLYLWDLVGQDHKKGTIDNFTAVAKDLSGDKKRLFLLGDAGSKRWISWDIEKWEKREELLPDSYQSMQVTPDGEFVLLQRETGSFLDMAFDEIDPAGPPFPVFSTGPWQQAKRLSTESPVTHIGGTPGYLFMACEDQIVRVWKKIDHSPFPLLHKLSYFYLKPASTIQDIGVQKRINQLLEESDRASAVNPQQALDCIRGIQNFKGYDWKLILYRIYQLATRNHWGKTGLRESLKINNFPWNEPDFTISPDGDYLTQAAFASTPTLWDVASLKQVTLEQVLGKIPQAQGKWLASRDGRYLIQQREKELSLYDIQNRRRSGPIAADREFEDAAANKDGSIVLLKPTGFNKLAILDLRRMAIFPEISQAKYHTIRDCSILVADEDEIMLASEAEGGFRWEMISREKDWESRTHDIPFSEEIAEQGRTDEGDAPPIIIANRSYIIFRGTNFDLVRDIYFRHIEVFELRHGVYFSLKGQHFRDAWLTAHAIATTPDGVYTFLSIGDGVISAWNTSGHIKNWQEAALLQEHEHPVTAMTLSSDGKFLISADMAGYIKIFRVGPWEVLDSLKADGAVSLLKVSPNDRYLFALAENGIHVWEFDWVWEVEAAQ